MKEKLEELSFQLNNHTSAAGATFDVIPSTEGDTLEVACSEAPDFPMYLTATENQILSVTPLFKQDTVKAGEIEKLNMTVLNMGPVVPLSAIGLQGDTYILYGAMAINTLFENIVHELEVQADNTNDVLEALQDFLA